VIVQPLLKENPMREIPKKKRQVRAQSKRDPFKPLLASLLTLDWEINDGNIQQYEGELKAMKKKLADDQYSNRLIDTTIPVCYYLRVKKGSASPASMQFLHSATRTLIRFWGEKLKASERKQSLEMLLVKYRSLMTDVQKLAPAAAVGKKKAPVRKAKKVTPTAEVLKVIKSREAGIDVSTLKQITGFTDRQTRGILYRASRAGKIKRISRGVYAST
jgi:hypothetical protein